MMTVVHNPNATHWNLENGYDDSIKNIISYPIHATDTSDHYGPLITLMSIGMIFENNKTCHGSVDGYKIFLNTQGEIPQISKHFFWAPFDENVVVYVKPQMITTSPDLRSYEPSQRQCFFSSERQLRFFKIYTQLNCELECLANFTRIECGCVKFGMLSKMIRTFKLTIFFFRTFKFFSLRRRQKYSDLWWRQNRMLHRNRKKFNKKKYL